MLIVLAQKTWLRKHALAQSAGTLLSQTSHEGRCMALKANLLSRLRFAVLAGRYGACRGAEENRLHIAAASSLRIKPTPPHPVRTP